MSIYFCKSVKTAACKIDVVIIAGIMMNMKDVCWILFYTIDQL